MTRSFLKAIVFLAAVLSAFSVLSVSAGAIAINSNGEVVERSGNGTINWTTGKLEAYGVADSDQSAYGQLKAAQIAARAELLTILKGIRIRGDYGVIQGLLKKDINEVQLDGFLVNSYVTKPRRNKLGLIEAKAFVYLDRHGNTLLMPKNSIPPSDAGSWQPPEPLIPTSTRYTGLIIDARGLGLKPAMAPRILVEGELLRFCGSIGADEKANLIYGLVGYAGTLEKARALKDRIGENPMEIKAIGAANETDVVISAEDAIEIARALKAYHFVKEGRVVFVVN